MTLYAAAQRFNLPFDTVKKQAKRNGWVTPQRIQRKVEELRAAQGLSPKTSLRVEKGAKTVQIAAETLLSKQEQHRVIVQQVTEKMWQKVAKAPPSVETVNDLEKLQKVTRLNLDMTTGEPQAVMQVLLGSQSDIGPSHVSQCVEVEDVGEFGEVGEGE